MKENTANHGRDRFDNDEQKKSNSPNSERENDAPASGLKNNDAWTTGLEAKTPMQEGNPPSYASLNRGETANESSSNAIKDPDQWKTGDEAMTDAQRSYLNTLSDEAGEEMNVNLTKAEASKRIEELQRKTGRGLDQNNSGEKENSF